MLTDNILVKNEIRDRLISLRRGLDIKWIGDKSIEIEERLFDERDFLEKTYILFYSAFEKEVQTKGMIKRAVEMNKKVFLPVTDFKNRNILISELYNKEEEIRIVPENVVEVIIVPGIAFSEIGGRIGFGKGFYDKFLSRLPVGVKTIGLAFDFQIVDEIPLYNHDFLLDRIITEKRVIDCKKYRDKTERG